MVLILFIQRIREVLHRTLPVQLKTNGAGTGTPAAAQKAIPRLLWGQYTVTPKPPTKQWPTLIQISRQNAKALSCHFAKPHCTYTDNTVCGSGPASPGFIGIRKRLQTGLGTRGALRRKARQAGATQSGEEG